MSGSYQSIIVCKSKSAIIHVKCEIERIGGRLDEFGYNQRKSSH